MSDFFKLSQYKPDKFKGVLSLLVSWFPNFNRDVLAFITSQVMLETGWLSSDVYLNNYNVVGMRHPRVRITFSKCKANGHAVYGSPLESFADYFLWMQYNRFTMADLNDLDLFISKLRKSNFNPSEKYVDTILKIYKIYYHE